MSFFEKVEGMYSLRHNRRQSSTTIANRLHKMHPQTRQARPTTVTSPRTDLSSDPAYPSCPTPFPSPPPLHPSTLTPEGRHVIRTDQPCFLLCGDVMNKTYVSICRVGRIAGLAGQAPYPQLCLLCKLCIPHYLPRPVFMTEAWRCMVSRCWTRQERSSCLK